jgi:hypothetical protein
MAFKLFISADEIVFHEYGDADAYELPSSGKLVVKPADGSATYTYSQ